jgi:hypothetical protein
MSTMLKVLGAVAALIVLPVACSVYSTYSSVVSAPSRVINKTLQTNNILTNYELFHDESKQFEARVAQLREHEVYLRDEKDPDERTRLRMEFGAQQQSCRELAADYNANSLKLNRQLFKDRGLPPVLDAQLCESST